MSTPLDQVDKALTALATTRGNARHALELMRESGHTPPPERTLYDWRHRYADRYQDIAQRLAPQVERELVTTFRETATKAAHLTSDLIDKTRDQMDANELKDPSAAARNIATAGAILTDKMLVVDGRPDRITEHRDLDTVLNALEILKVKAIQGTATEELEVPLIAESCESNARELVESSEDRELASS